MLRLTCHPCTHPSSYATHYQSAQTFGLQAAGQVSQQAVAKAGKPVQVAGCLPPLKDRCTRKQQTMAANTNSRTTHVMHPLLLLCDCHHCHQAPFNKAMIYLDSTLSCQLHCTFSFTGSMGVCSYQAVDLGTAELMQPTYMQMAAILEHYVDLFLCETLASTAETMAAASAACRSGQSALLCC